MGDGRFLPISRVECGQIAFDIRFNFFHPPLQFGAGEIPIPIIDGFEFAAINGNQSFREQTELLAQYNELFADTADCLAVVLAKVGNGLEVRHQPTGQPHQFNVTSRFPLKTPAGLNAIQITVNVDLEENGRVIGRATGGCRIYPFESELAQIKLIHIYVNDTHRIGFGYIVVEHFRE